MTRDVLDDLPAIRAFVAVAAAGAFGAGGRTVGLTRSAAGKAVARLEAHLGTRLFHRTARRVGLTADGRIFHDRCVVILADLLAAEASVRPDRQCPRGTLRVTVPDAFGRSEVMPALVEFLARWPALAVEASVTDRPVDIVADGLDLAIRLGALPRTGGLVTRVIARSRHALYAAPAYLARHGKPAEPAALGGHARLLYADRAGERPWHLRGSAGATAAIDGPARLRCDNGDALRAASVAGLGIALLPRFLARADLEHGHLVPVLDGWEGPELAVHAIMPAESRRAPRVRLFLDLLEARFAMRAGAL